MDKTNFTKDAPGTLVKIPEGVWAFVPDSLPPTQFEVSWQLMNVNSEADRALSELVGVARTLPNPHLLTGAFTRREAVLSSRIEGTLATMSQLFLFEAAGSGPLGDSREDVIEVHNYIMALESGLSRLNELPVCKRLILETHHRLLQGVRGDDKTPGEFRKRQNFIGPVVGCKIEDATFVPPPVNEMHHALDELDKYMNGESFLPPLIRQALIHYQFEAIHPFLDGNGRIGRLLLTLLLCAEKIMPQPLLYLSDYIERHKGEYYRLLLAVSQEGRWNDWLMFFLRGVTEQSRDAIRRARNLQDLWQDYRDRLARGLSTLPLRLIDELFDVPMISTTQATKLLEVTPHSAIKTINRLVDEGILRELETGRQRNKIYIAPDIRKAVED